ncbi:MAG: ACP S-malonyltransferase [Eubacteriales bacterium]|nr:ACP S-malonyltransferase [Eubacteriales bacterium]
MARVAIVFPGQGAQQPGMGQALYEASPEARALMDRAEGMMPGLLETCFGGPMERLTRTDIAQPALYMVESALAEALLAEGVRGQAAAGFSLGEWPACRYAGIMGFEAGFELVRQRGAFMQACAQESPGGMAAVLRLSADQLNELLKRHPELRAVNFNAPGQTVVAGPIPALEAFEQDLRGQGLRSMRLNVAGAFHSPLMEKAAGQLSRALHDTPLNSPEIPVYSNLTALPYAADTARDWLPRQLASPVRWEESIRNMGEAGYDTFLELGPGRVLSGLIGKILPGASTLQAEDMDGIRQAAEQLGGQA